MGQSGQPKKLTRVRCLGPGPEHSFYSRDRVRERICYACREKLKTMPQSIRDFPATDPTRQKFLGE